MIIQHRTGEGVQAGLAVVTPQGMKGSQGAIGPQGTVGAQGATGSQGAAGYGGPQGVPGTNRNIPYTENQYIILTTYDKSGNKTTTYIPCKSIKGI